MDEPEPHHRLSVDRTLGSLHLRADLELSAPWTLLFGPSGSGKSSLLRAACGLLGQEGVVFFRREAPGFDVPLITRRRFTASHQLRLGYAPQQGALFPHLCVRENVGFASDNKRSGEREQQVDALLNMFDIGTLRDRWPAMLSGGERQRVNLARAFAVPNVRLLLLDEPFTGLGRELRDRLIPRMLAWTRAQGVPVLSVSHDVDEALLLNADVFVLHGGSIVRSGRAAEALSDERTRLLQVLQQQHPVLQAHAAALHRSAREHRE